MQHVRKRPARWPWLLVAVAVAAAGWWLLRPGAQTLAPVPPAAEAPQQDEGPPPVLGQEQGSAPPIRHPLEPLEPLAAAADAAIPALADSDVEVFAALEGLAGNPSVLGILLREHLVQRLVVTVDNLTEPRVTSAVLAMRQVPGQYATAGTAGEVTGDVQANAARYAPYVDAFTGADPQRLANVYRRFYPLFQEAYAELGQPGAYFNDRLVQVIDHLLQAPAPPVDAALVPDGRGRMRYVDPALESASVGHKALMRLSPQQQAAVKAQLRALRGALATP